MRGAVDEGEDVGGEEPLQRVADKHHPVKDAQLAPKENLIHPLPSSPGGLLVELLLALPIVSQHLLDLLPPEAENVLWHSRLNQF